MPIVKTSFKLKDGRILECEYGYRSWRATRIDPAEYEQGEPTYTLDGTEVVMNKLPKGLDVIAEALYNASEGEYNYRESNPNSYED